VFINSKNYTVSVSGGVIGGTFSDPFPNENEVKMSQFSTLVSRMPLTG